MSKTIPAVSLAYASSDRSMRAIELGMRQMQERWQRLIKRYKKF